MEEPKEPKEHGKLIVLFSPLVIEEEQEKSEYASLPNDDKAVGDSDAN